MSLHMCCTHVLHMSLHILLHMSLQGGALEVGHLRWDTWCARMFGARGCSVREDVPYKLSGPASKGCIRHNNTTYMHIIVQNIIHGKQDMCVDLDQNQVKHTSEIQGEKKFLGFAEPRKRALRPLGPRPHQSDLCDLYRKPKIAVDLCDL